MPVLTVTIDGRTYKIETPGVFTSQDRMVVRVDGQPVEVTRDNHSSALTVLDNHPYIVTSDRDLRWLETRRGLHRIEVRDTQAAVLRPASGDGRVKAPIPGLIATLHVAAGQTVEAGQPLLILEAMKMQNEIRAPFAGVVRALPIAQGQTVARAQVLIEIE